MYWISSGGHITGTLQRMPSNLVIERRLLFAMKTHGKTLNAFSTLPPNVRLMYLHAYQSYIWNNAASKRIKMQETLSVMVGDLVLKGDEVIHVTPDNIGMFHVKDIQIPLPGHSVMFPKHELTEYMKELMEKDELDMFNMRRAQSFYSLPGQYRPLIRICNMFNYTIRKYNHYDEPLCFTDLEILEKKTHPETSGDNTAVVLELMLNSGTYATMVIRELTKNPTSIKYQREMQQQLEALGLFQPSVKDMVEEEEEDELVEEPEGPDCEGSDQEKDDH
eukprot:TRINITY_DN2179_c0_g1_i3.p1 TRINITY_DN2179_c0_g1~~TRINITY_DN2179_c0_g1_i3.p1  ORF type:complete len:277 (-),score=54.33 TRINITY_DN2179_c0_g1_i3:67-897(-)